MKPRIKDPLVDAFDLVTARRPGEAVVVSESRQCTAAGLDGLARAARRRIGEAGLAPGGVVALLAPNGPAFLASVIALRRAGLVVLPIEQSTPEEERRRIGRRLGAAASLICRAAWPRGEDDWVVEPSSEKLSPPGWTDGLALIKLTSGSTGEPRGVATPAEALIADDRALTASMGIGADDRILATVPFSHSYGLSSLVVPALVRGALLAVPDREGPFHPLQTARAVSATVFPTVPAYLAGLLRLSRAPELPSSLRRIIAAGAPIAPETAAEFRERFGLGVHVFYGSSESGGISYDREGGAAERGTVGAPVEGARIRVDVENGNGSGRVVVESSSVARGYVPDSDDRLGGGRYLTDDLGEFDRGELRLVGRLGDTINVKGHKVNPREIEGVLSLLDQVVDVCVLGIEGRGGRGRVVRAVVACESGALNTETVLDWCRRHLAEYKVPRSVVLVTEIPRTERGKPDRASMRAEPGPAAEDRPDV